MAATAAAWWCSNAWGCANEFAGARRDAWMAVAGAGAVGFVVLGALGTGLAAWAVLRVRRAAPHP